MSQHHPLDQVSAGLHGSISRIRFTGRERYQLVVRYREGERGGYQPVVRYREGEVPTSSQVQLWSSWRERFHGVFSIGPPYPL